MVNVVFLKDLAVLILSSIVLIYSGIVVVRSLVKLSYRLHVKEYILAFVLLAFSTSIPELFVGITSALNKSSILSLGNVIGANIMDVTFVIGVAAIIARRFPFRKKLVRSTSIYAVGIAAMPVALAAFGNELSRIDGIILIAVFFLYMWKMVKERKEEKKKLKGKEALEDGTKLKDAKGIKRIYFKIKNKLYFNIIMFVIGIALVFFSADYVTKAAINIAYELNLPRLLIGMILVAIGTTLPELVLEARIALTKMRDMAFGDPLGSVVINSTFIIGLVSLIYPIKIESIYFYTGGLFMIAATSLIAIMLNIKKELTWKDGILLLIVYMVFLIVQLSVKAVTEAL